LAKRRSVAPSRREAPRDKAWQTPTVMSRAAVLTRFGELPKIQRVEIPAPEGSQILVRVEAAGICHTDLHLCSGTYHLGGERRIDVGTRVRLPHVPGHEIVGRIEAVGPDASRATIGDRVLVYPWSGCGTCPVCMAGHDPLCANPRFTGIDTGGGYAEHVLLACDDDAVAIGDLDPVATAPLACAGLSAWAAIDRLPVDIPSGAIAVLGCGGIGLAAIALLRRRRPDLQILAVDHTDERAHAATVAGADHFSHRLDALPPSIAVIDCVGSAATLTAAMKCVRKGGAVVVIGLAGGAVELPVLNLPLKAMTLAGSYVGTRIQFAALLASVQQHGPLPLPTEAIPLEDVPDAMSRLANGSTTGRSVIVP